MSRWYHLRIIVRQEFLEHLQPHAAITDANMQTVYADCFANVITNGLTQISNPTP